MTTTVRQLAEPTVGGTTTVRTVSFTPTSVGPHTTVMVFVFWAGSAVRTLNSISTASSGITGWAASPGSPLTIPAALATNGRAAIWTAQPQSLSALTTSFTFNNATTAFDSFWFELRTDNTAPAWSFIGNATVISSSTATTDWPAPSLAGNNGDFYAANFVQGGTDTFAGTIPLLNGFVYDLTDGVIYSPNTPSDNPSPWQPGYTVSVPTGGDAYVSWGGVMRPGGTPIKVPATVGMGSM